MALRSVATPGEPAAASLAALHLEIAQELGGVRPFQWFAGSDRFEASPALNALLGLDPEASVRVGDLLARVPDEDRPALDAARRRALQGRGDFEVEFRIRPRSGAPRWMLSRGRRLCDPGGALIAVAGVVIDIDARKRAEREAAAREAGFRAVQEASPDGFMVFEALRDAAGAIEDFRWLHLNPAACRIVGRSAADLIGRRMLEVLPGNRAEGLFDAYRQVVEAGAPLTREVTYRHDGLDTHFRLSAAPVGDGFAVTFADLTQRHRLEQASRAAERQWRAVLDTIPQKVWTALPGGLCDFFNARWYEYTGAAHGETDGARWLTLVHPEDAKRAVEAWRRAEAAESLYEVEYRLRTAGGGYRWVLARALPFHDEDGRVLRWFGTCTDIHDFKAAEGKLRGAEERLALALDAVQGVGVWEFDVAADRVTASGRFAELFGLDPAAGVEGRSLGDFLDGVFPADRPGLEAAIGEAMLRGGTFEAEYRLVAPAGGGPRWVMARGHCDLDAEGRPLRLPGALVDITDRKLAEETRELLARELSHRIKNIFALVSSLVTFTARDHPGAEDFARGLRARLQSLGRAHDCVRPGGAGAATVHALLATLFAPHSDPAAPRIRLAGEDAAIGEQSATALALILHEAATNSAKYGALSLSGGAVEVATAREAEGYRIAWRERGGPDVAPPAQSGFGTLMADRAAQQLGGRLTRSWEAGGLRLALDLPAVQLSR